MQKFCVSKNSRNRPEHHVIQWLSALQKNKMLRYSPWEIMGKKLNTIMWVQSSWTGTLVWHFAMSPSVTASPGEENSLPKRGTHLKVRQEMCFYAAEFLAATKLTAKGKFFRFPKICLKNVDKYMSCHWQASSGSNYQTNVLFRGLGF